MTSTRAELAGAIVTLCLHGAWHLQADNAAFIGRTQKIATGTMKKRKPWGLLPDGDLWEMLESAIRSKGYHAVWFSWGKGHATLADMADGNVNVADAIANGYADKAADEGHRLYGRHSLKEYAAVFGAKQQASARLFAAIHRRIARVQVAAGKAREEARRSQADTEDAWMPPPAPPPSDVDAFYSGHRLYIRDYPIGMLSDIERFIHVGIRLFWTTLRLRPCGADEPGTSWLELFALWQAAAGEDLRPEPRGMNEPRPRFHKAYVDFRRRSQALFQHGDAATQGLCRTSNTRRAPLLKCGLLSSIPCISSRVVLLPERAAKLHAMICRFQSGRSSSSRPSHKRKVGKFKAPKFPPWLALCNDPPLPGLVFLRIQGWQDDQLHRGQGGPCEPRPACFELACPRCSEISDMAKRVLFHPGLSIQLWCGSCMRSASSRLWACSCSCSWMACPVHRPQGFACKTRLSLKRRVSDSFAKGLASQRAFLKRKRLLGMGEFGLALPPLPRALGPLALALARLANVRLPGLPPRPRGLLALLPCPLRTSNARPPPNSLPLVALVPALWPAVGFLAGLPLRLLLFTQRAGSRPGVSLELDAALL